MQIQKTYSNRCFEKSWINPTFFFRSHQVNHQPDCQHLTNHFLRTRPSWSGTGALRALIPNVGTLDDFMIDQTAIVRPTPLISLRTATFLTHSRRLFTSPTAGRMCACRSVFL